MFTWGSKYLFGMSIAAFLAAVVYGLTSGGGIIGVISAGYKGGVGDHTGYGLLIAVSLICLVLGIVTVMTRDGDAEDMSALVDASVPLSVKTPASSSFWAPLSAFGVACLVVGVAVSSVFIYLGVAVLAVTGLEWAVQAWSENVTGDDELNDTIRNRAIGPIEIPMLGTLAIAVIVIGISRVLLAVSELSAVVIASLAAVFIFGAAILISKSRAPRQIVSAIVTFGAVAVLAGGIVGAAAGERDFSHGHESDHSEEGDHSEDGDHSEEEGDHSEEGDG